MNIKNYPQCLKGATEDDCKKFVVSQLSSDFDIYPEEEGKFLVDNETKVIIDFLLYPKEHLKKEQHKKGKFVDGPIGLEVKTPTDLKNLSIKVAWQCITYSMSSFKGQRPPFILLFPSIRYSCILS